MAAGVLAVLAIVTTPLVVAQAKYTASGTVTASARVAKWDIKFTQDPATGGTGYFSGAVVSSANPNANAGYPAQTTETVTTGVVTLVAKLENLETGNISMGPLRMAETISHRLISQLGLKPNLWVGFKVTMATKTTNRKRLPVLAATARVFGAAVATEVYCD